MFDKPQKKDQLVGTTDRIVQGTKITGDIETQSDMRIDGELIGNITSSSKIVIGPSGQVQGEIKCNNIDIEGSFQGKLEIDELMSLKKTAHVLGDVSVNRISIEPGAIFDATCTMKGVKKLKSKTSEKNQKETA